MDDRQTTDTEYYGPNDVTPEEVDSWDAETPPEFKLTAEHFNAALQAADITGITLSERPGLGLTEKTAAGSLWLDTGDLEYQDVINKLLNGLVLLHARSGFVSSSAS